MLAVPRVIQALRVVLVVWILSGCSGKAGRVILPRFQGAAIPPTETPLAASAFNESIGVNLHMIHTGAYITDFAK